MYIICTLEVHIMYIVKLTMYMAYTFLLIYIACTSFVHYRYIIMYIVKLTMYMAYTFCLMYIACT